MICRCLLLTQHDEWLSSKANEKHFKFYVMDSVHPSKPTILNTIQYSILKQKTMYCNYQIYQRHMKLKSTLSNRHFVLDRTRKVQNYKTVYKNVARLASLLLHTDVIVSVTVRLRYKLRFTQNFLKIFKRRHFYFSKLSLAFSKSDGSDRD